MDGVRNRRAKWFREEESGRDNWAAEAERRRSS